MKMNEGEGRNESIEKRRKMMKMNEGEGRNESRELEVRRYK